MRLYDEIFKSVDGISLARCIFVPNGGGYFEGVKSVSDFSEDRVALCFPQFTLVAQGRGLTIKKYCDGDLQLSGEIYALYVEGSLPIENSLHAQDAENRNSAEKRNSAENKKSVENEKNIQRGKASEGQKSASREENPERKIVISSKISLSQEQIGEKKEGKR